MLKQLPDDVLRHIMRLADQEARVACMSACRALHRAAGALGVWTEVTLYDLDPAAVAFMERHRCPVVRVVTDCPDDVAWFFEQLYERGIVCVRHLRIELGAVMRVPMDLLCGIGVQDTLERLSIRVHSLDGASEICFCKHHRLQRLRTLEISEHTEQAKHLVVWMDDTHDRFHRLTSVALDVGLSDIMAGLRHVPTARRVAYSFETDGEGGGGGETFEDMELAGARLDSLDLDLDGEVDTATMAAELCKCDVGTLTLHVKDEHVDLAHGFGRVRRLVLRLHLTYTNIRLDFEALRACRQLEELVVDAAPLVTGMCAPTLYFVNVPSPGEWAAHVAPTGPLRLDVLPTAQVHLSPMD